MSHTFKVGDRVRVKDLPIMHTNPSWEACIGQIRHVDAVDFLGVRLRPPIGRETLFDRSVLELFPENLADWDEGGVV